MFTREDWELFRSLQTLTQKAGISRDHLGALVAKELVDNALDAVEGRDDANVRVGYLSDDAFYVEDDGDGIDPAQLHVLFSIRRPMTSTKLLRLPTRGALGNGLRVVAGAVLASGGNLIVYTRGQAMQLVPQDSGETLPTVCGTYDGPGTRVEVKLGNGLVDKNTLAFAESAIDLRRGDTYKGKTSPHWYDADTFYELGQAAGSIYVRDLIGNFDGCTGTRAGEIADGFQGRACNTLTRDEALILLKRARAVSRPVKAARLGKVGDIFSNGSYASGEFIYKIDGGRSGISCEIPLIVEAWVFPEMDAGFDISINKTPALAGQWVRFEKQKLTLAAGKWRLGEFPTKTPCHVAVNIQTPYMPITSDGKTPDLTALRTMIEQMVGKAIRKAKRGTTLGQADGRVTLKDVVFDNVEHAAAVTSSDHRYRYSQRQLFYTMRNTLMQTFGKDPSFDTFAQYLTEYEAIYGEIKGMYRDPRGTVYHPHTGEEIPLGTLNVEDYKRPKWTFNKVLYAEKEGLFAILKAEHWAEKHDCLLMTSKGQASRAAKDLIDLLGDSDSDEPLKFFCIHDADAAGTMIYQSLQEATAARERRSVEVINLGLDPQEAVAMGLQVEEPTYSKRQPVAEYIDTDWAHWLQTHRVELNAMNSETFIGWLDAKFAGLGKVKPPDEVVSDELADKVEEKLREQIRERILQDAGFEAQVEGRLQELKPKLVHAVEVGHVSGRIDSDLEANPTNQWREAVAKVATEIVDDVPITLAGPPELAADTDVSEPEPPPSAAAPVAPTEPIEDGAPTTPAQNKYDATLQQTRAAIMAGQSDTDGAYASETVKIFKQMKADDWKKPFEHYLSPEGKRHYFLHQISMIEDMRGRLDKKLIYNGLEDLVRRTQFKAGQRVYHAKFGEGTVIDSRPYYGQDEEVQVQFADHGVKMLAARFANLTLLDEDSE
jgi:hypothetical protein